MNILEYIIDEDKVDYRCYDVLKERLKNDEKFLSVIQEGILSGKISKYSEDLWDKIRSQNIRGIDNFEDVFRDGANIGYCTVAAKQLSYSLDSCFLCGGVVSSLIGTPNCIDGSHTWISCDGKVIDTTLMLVIDEEYTKTLGYVEENRYNPNLDPVYCATKEWTNDRSLNKGGKTR